VIRAELVRVFAVSFGAMVAFYLLLSVVPLYAASARAGDVGAGLTSGALLPATVGAEFITPRLAARFGYRLVLGLGVVLLGVPALALTGSAHLAAILTISAVRGFGFGIVVVIGSALVASIVPPHRRGEGLGLYGVVVGVPSVLALPLGVFLVEHTGYDVVFLIGAVAALAGLVVVPGLPGRPPPRSWLRTAGQVPSPRRAPSARLTGNQDQLAHLRVSTVDTSAVGLRRWTKAAMMEP
jgi:MFS family permease